MPEWPVGSSYFSCLLEGGEGVDSFNESRGHGGETGNGRGKSSQAKKKA